jgi:hypothetical protein
MAGLQLLLCRALLFGGCLLRVAFYLAKGILRYREIDRIKAKVSWRAFKALIQRQV